MKAFGMTVVLALAALAVAGNVAHAQTAWKPERNIEIIVGSSPGTGTDRTARLIQKIWQEQKALPVTSTVINKPGAGGAVGWAYLVPKAGDAHFLQVSSYNLVTNHITGRSNLTYTDFTPISLLISEYIGFAVKADSPYKTLADLARALRENPESVPIGTSSSAGGANHIAAGLLAKAAGADVKKLKVVIYSGGGEALTATLGGACCGVGQFGVVDCRSVCRRHDPAAGDCGATASAWGAGQAADDQGGRISNGGGQLAFIDCAQGFEHGAGGVLG